MKPLRPVAAAVIATALLTVPAHGDHKRYGGFFIEPFFVPVFEQPFAGRSRQQAGYPVALVRKRLHGIGFSRIGRFDVYPGAYGVSATDPGGVRVNLVIDRWSGDIVRARAIEAGPAVQPLRPPAMVGRAPQKMRSAALPVPPLPRPAPERLTQTVSVSPSPEDYPEPVTSVPEAVQDEDIMTSSTNRAAGMPESDSIGDPASMPPPLPGAGPGKGTKTPPSGSQALAEVAAAPKSPAIAESDAVAVAVIPAPTSARPVSAMPVAGAPVAALQEERFDPADFRDPIAVY